MRAIAALYRYPVKGLSAEPLAGVRLSAGDGFPLDRSMAITDGTWLFDADTYEPRPKAKFLMLARDEALAALRTRVSTDGRELTVISPDDERIVVNVDDDESVTGFSQFLKAYLPGTLAGEPRLVRSERHRFTDASVVSPAMMSAISIINLASVRDLERVMGCAIDPLRFRANIHLDGGDAWEENDWVGRELTLGDARVRVVKRIKRCPATNVDPASGIRDRDIPQALSEYFGNRDMGVYAEVIEGGAIRPGAQAELCA